MTAWSFNLQATQTVRRNALHADDRRELLEMLGLVAPGSRVMLPDDTRSYSTDFIVMGGDAQANDRSPVREVGERPPPNVTTPAGLAVLGPPDRPPAETRTPKPRAAAKGPTPKPRKAAPPRPPAECGTKDGYYQHKRNGHDPCPPCQAAIDVFFHERALKGNAARTSARKVAECGTPSGVARHRRLNEPVCEPCRLARNTAQREYDARHRAKVQAEWDAAHPAPVALPPAATADAPAPAKRRPGPRLKPIPHGTYNGYRAHYRRQELPVCDACNEAYRERTRARAAQKRGATAAEHAAADRVTAIAVELDVWFAEAQVSASHTVRAIALDAALALDGLRDLMDALARAERAFATPREVS